MADVAHEALLLSAELVELAPLPGLAPAAKTLLNIWDAMQDVDVRRLPPPHDAYS
jgi:abelson tyrosine-protein kinase 1